MTEAGWHRKEPPDPSAHLSGPGPSGPDPALRAADPRTVALEAYIEASMEQLLHGDPRAQEHGLIFLSSWHEAMPALVHQDPVLDPVDSRVFAVLWIWAKQQGRGALAFPSYDHLLRRCNVHSRSTLARSLAILRITRWVTLCRRVRDRSGRNRGNIYALHDEPLALASTLYLDPDYIEFLDIKARDPHERVARVAKAMRASLQERIDEGEDVLASSPLLQSEQRLEAIATVVGKGGGHYFWLRQGALATLQTAKKDPPDRAQEKGKNRVQKLDSGAPSEMGATSVQNLDSGICSSSCLRKKTTTTTARHSEPDPASRPEPITLSPLVYPEPLSRNEQGLARMYLRGLDPELQQALLDELAGKIQAQAKTARPVRNPIGLLAWMCREAKAGRPPLTSAHLRCRERRERERHLKDHLEAERRRLTEIALQKVKA